MTERPAVAEWRAQLEAWAIPPELLAQAEESPYGWPQDMWRRRSRVARAEPLEAETTRIVKSLAPPGGTVLDVGAGRGRASLPLATSGLSVTAVEHDPGMAEGLREEAATLGVEVGLVEGRWPDVASRAPVADVVMCANVVYDVQDIEPFLRAMVDHAIRGVTIELTPSHPWSDLTDYYRAIHGLERPSGPTVDDLVAVISEIFGLDPTVVLWERSGGLWYTDRDELIDYMARRLVVPRRRRAEVAALVEKDIHEDDGRVWWGDRTRRLVTVWWRV